MSWLAHLFGLDDLSGPWYGFWSGIGSDIGEVVIIGAIIQWWRRSTCHVTGCHRLALHHVHGTPYITCRRHHPDPKGLTAEHVEKAHRESRRERH